MDDLKLGQLKVDTIAAVDRYREELQNTAANLNRIMRPSDELNTLLEAQQRAEREAYNEYQNLRQQLFRAIGANG